MKFRIIAASSLLIVSIVTLAACSTDEPASIPSPTPQPTATSVSQTSTPVPTMLPQATKTVLPATLVATAIATTQILAAAPTPVPTLTRVCTANALTPPQTEGPYFKAGSPERKSLLETGVTGPRLVLSGQVLSRDCKPVTGARVDFWQADANGVYDNSGFKLRGHQFTDSEGKYSLETVYPGLYPGRTRHIHVMIRLPVVTLTTQIYFPGEQRNATDGIFNQALVVAMQETQDGKAASFNFVLNIDPN